MRTPRNTPTTRLLHWEEQLPAERVWVKNEQGNPTGTLKDRRSFHIMQRAKEEQVHKIVLISMGNAAYSLARYAEETGIEIHAVVDVSLTESIRAKLRQVCTVTEVDLHAELISSEELIEMVRTHQDEKILDGTNKYHDAYRAIVYELKRDLPSQPDTIFLPFGVGEVMTGIIRGIEDVGWREGTTVIGINNRSSERLRADYVNRAYFDCFERDQVPVRAVVGIEPHMSPEDIQQYCVPSAIRSEEAAANVFYYVMVGRGMLADVIQDKKIVIINSGCGHVLDEAE